MYAPSSLISSPHVQQFHDFSYSHYSNASLGSVVESCVISDYDLGIEGDLFKAPEPILEQPEVTLQELNDEYFNNVFNEMSPLSEVLNCEFLVKTNESSVVKESVHPPGQIQKSVSSDCLGSMDRVHGAPNKPGFFINTQVEFGNVYGMRRAFSDGDIKTLSHGNENHTRSSFGQSHLMSDHIVEDRWQKLSRYRNKKTKRNFGRKVKYACRKALAESQPRIKGRFAKTEESEIWRK
ncbi:hypothetical protein QVD17_30969 [Tagetes erecta]|uniref:CCT domain-containing protein n=1 Tax=Tagetes erecta TaxID=13708 RepID=A0AAD8K682_TARER|nr:hypothetical protein QVD17_30969 [Tagetes erecta]